MITEHDLLKIIKYAIKSPSGHNTQPWKFKTGKDTVEIIPDFNRSLPVADADNHALYISIGCALENFKIASAALGFKTQTQFLRKDEGLVVHINLTEDSEALGNKLFSYIELRQVRRNHYLPEEIPANVIAQLLDACREEGIQFRPYLSREEITELKPFILEAAELQFRNRQFKTELIKWTRFSEKEALRKGDGTWTATMGIPAMGRTIGKFMLKYIVTATSERRRWEKVLERTAGLILFSVEKNEPLYWIKLGCAFQRFGLTATKLGLSHAHVNMPCEELVVRSKMTEQLNLTDFTPLLLIRIGFSQPMPYAFRRHFNETVIKI